MLLPAIPSRRTRNFAIEIFPAAALLTYLKYRRRRPSDRDEGDKVDEGDTLFIIEAMKTMNPVTAPKAGRVQKILVQNGSPVEYDEILALID